MHVIANRTLADSGSIALTISISSGSSAIRRRKMTYYNNQASHWPRELLLVDARRHAPREQELHTARTALQRLIAHEHVAIEDAARLHPVERSQQRHHLLRTERGELPGGNVDWHDNVRFGRGRVQDAP